MKGKRTLFGMVIAGMLTIMAQPSVSLAYVYNGAWLPNHVNMFAININSGAGSLYLYDYGDTSKNMLLLNTKCQFVSVYFTEDSNGYWAGFYDDLRKINLGSSKEFGFYFGNGNYSYELVGPNYKLINSSMTVLIHDAAPVPLPASALFFGSGVVGLIAFGRVRRNS